MDIHKDCYSAIDLTRQDGPHRRETGLTIRSQESLVLDCIASDITTSENGAKSQLCLRKRQSMP
jgi:hypothetical protein